MTKGKHIYRGKYVNREYKLKYLQQTTWI